MLWIAHRGESFDAPENTMSAFRLAAQSGADGIECDIHLTLDGEIVCIHDADTGRVSNADLKIAETSFPELRKLDFGSWKDARWQGEKIPLLAELLDVVKPGMKVFIEVKSGPAIINRLKPVLKKSALADNQIIIISFDQAAIAEAKKQLPQLKACWLCSYDENCHPSAEEIINILRRNGADGVDSHCADFLDAGFVRKIHDAGFEFHVWTIDEPEKAAKFKKFGVDSITSNRAGFLKSRT
ncbi:MAG: glycerophosphodiester phosphodiesterase [Victivallaceae bacterium]|jgi:glycerophosphoryl diester phosphodiesterase